MSEGPSKTKTTRRDVLKLAGAAAMGAAGMAALGAPRVLAAGSGQTLALFAAPSRLIDTRGHTKLGHGGEVTLGPFPVPGPGGFTSDGYLGIVGNLTATAWTGAGWLAVRPNGTTFTAVSNVNFAGPFPAWSNFFICQFGPSPGGLGQLSDGKFIVHSGAAPTNFIIDLIGFLGPDQ
jgi:hypothetical protein